MNSLDVDLLSLLFTLFATIISVVWTISNIRHDFQLQISAGMNEVKLELSELRREVELLKVEVRNESEKQEYFINDVSKRIDHKSLRLENWIQDINNYLEKQGNFKARTGLNRSPD